jgi:hypothetical protein
VTAQRPRSMAATFVYLGKANGILAPYTPPHWKSCPIADSCRRATWKLHEADMLLRVEANPPDRHAPKDW